MKIIPVMDILQQKVVHGIAGRRNEYQPIENSVLTKSSNPLNVAQDFKDNLRIEYCYIADLDLIQQTEKANSNKQILQHLASSVDLKFLVDGGCKNLQDVQELLKLGLNFVILGTETLESLEALEEICSIVGNRRIILSIDLHNGKLLTTNPHLKEQPLSEIIAFVDKLDLYAIIVLELSKVGSKRGPISNSLLTILDLKPKTEIFAGGGVRDLTDLQELKKKGIAGCLIATAFHNGSITYTDLQELKGSND